MEGVGWVQLWGKQMELYTVTQALGDYINDAVLITEAEPITGDGPKVVWCNKAFTLMTGYFPKDIIGQTPRLLQGEGTDPAAINNIHEALVAWKPIRQRLLNYKKSGEEFFIELDIKPIADESGWYHYWIAIQREVDHL